MVPNAELSFNRRIHQRFPAQIPVRFSSEMMDFDGTAELEGSVENVSLGGLFIRSEFLELPGTPVQLEIAPPSGAPLSLRGQVAWVAREPPEGPGMGIRLLGTLDGAALAAVTGYSSPRI